MLITEKILNDIILDITHQANSSEARRHKMVGQPARGYYHGREVGLRMAISIIKKHQILANPK